MVTRDCHLADGANTCRCGRDEVLLDWHWPSAAPDAMRPLGDRCWVQLRGPACVLCVGGCMSSVHKPEGLVGRLIPCRASSLVLPVCSMQHYRLDAEHNQASVLIGVLQVYLAGLARLRMSLR